MKNGTLRTETDFTSFTSRQQQIAVPETLLKKRKTSEKTREEKLVKASEARKVRPCSSF